MSYDIPDEVKYREKIVFGLDLKQLCYFCVFAMLAFLSLNLPLEGEAKFILPSFFCILGAGFIFLNLEEKVIDAYHFYSGVRKASSSDAKAQQLVGVREIENNQITLTDGSLRAVLKVEPINFSLLDEGQKTAFVSNYREFLNHLTDPIQILVRTEKCNAETAFAQLAGKENATLFRDFFTFEREFMEANSVRSRKYYLIITQYKTDDAPMKLGQKLQIIQEKLSSCGLRSERLSSTAITRLFSTYSMAENEGQGDMPKKAKPISNIPLATTLAKIRKLIEPSFNSLIWFFIKIKISIIFPPLPVAISKSLNLQKKQPKPEDPLASIKGIAWKRADKSIKFPVEEITPDFDITGNCAKVNGICHRIIKATGYPRNVDDGWLESFMATSEPYDVSLHIHPASISRTLAGIHNQIIRQTSDLLTSQGEGTPNPSLQIKRDDTMNVYGLLYKGKEKMFEVSLYVDSQADSMNGLELMSERCKANMNSLLIVPKSADYRMADGIKSMLPMGIDALGARREFLTSALCATFPFLYPVDSRMEGVFFAHERRTLNPIFLDFDAMSNKHFFVLGISGSGKSYAAKFLLLQHMLSDAAKVYVLDPNAEYSSLVRQLGGSEISLSKDSEKIINLFDLAGEDFGGKMLTLISVFDIITGGLTESQKGVLNDALVRVYGKKGIEAANPKSWGKTAPTFSDLKGILEDMRAERRNAQSPEEKSIEVLLNRVKMYSKGGFFGFLDRGTKVDLGSRMLSFNLSGLPAQVRQLVMFSVLELVAREIRKDKNPKVVLIDEGWSLLRSKEAENYILEFIKTSRKYNASIGFITQEIEDLMRSEGGRSILNTTSTKILLRQNSSNLDLISKTLALNERERDYLLRAGKGQGLLISELGRYEFKVLAPPLMHSLITTDPNEKAFPVQLEGMDKGAKEGEKEKADGAEAPKRGAKKRRGPDGSGKRARAKKGRGKRRAVDKKEKKKVEIDCARGFYREDDLTNDQMDELIKKDYTFCQSKLFDRNGSKNFLVKVQPQESLEHSLLCWAIADEMRKCGGKPVVRATQGADVTVEIGERTVCFEVETGSNIDSHGEDEVRKKFDERRVACDLLIVVVTNRKQRARYGRIARARAITRTDVPRTIQEQFR